MAEMPNRNHLQPQQPHEQIIVHRKRFWTAPLQLTKPAKPPHKERDTVGERQLTESTAAVAVSWANGPSLALHTAPVWVNAWIPIHGTISPERVFASSPRLERMHGVSFAMHVQNDVGEGVPRDIRAMMC